MNIDRNNKFLGFVPAGGYIAQITVAKYDQSTNRLLVRFDIAEGEYKGFFRKLYDNNPSNDWNSKGQQIFDFNYASKYGWKVDYTERNVNNLIDALEQSNNYTFQNPLESATLKWKNLKVGVVYKKDEYNGKPTTKFPEFTTVENIKNGAFTLESSNSTQSSAVKEEEDDSSLNSFDIDDDDIQF